MHSRWPFFCGLAVIVAILAITVFKVSPGNLLFYGALLACPLMHVFMMKDHGQKKHKE